MNAYLLRWAIDNIWCNPAQDRQFVYKLPRITPNLGAKGNVMIELERFALPTPNDRYHVYQIGRAHSTLLGLPSVYNLWMSRSNLTNHHALHTELYTNSGLQFPRNDSYLMLTDRDCLVVAVKIHNSIADLDVEDLYIRFYSNAYFNSERSDVTGERWLYTLTAQPINNTDLVDFQIRVNNEVATRGGVPIYLVNGRLTNEISLTNCQAGDILEVVLDSSITGYIDFPVKNLPEFVSTLDSERKLILHNADPTVETIEYLDDLDVYLYKVSTIGTGRFLGVTYHRNTVNWLRQLTFKDYSVSLERLNGFVQTHPSDPRVVGSPNKFDGDNWTNVLDLVIRVYRRKSGYDRTLTTDVNRIRELYRLDDATVIAAMTGANATNPLWNAANLEASPFMEFIQLPPESVYPITYNSPDASSVEKVKVQELAGEALGYYGAGSVLAPTPLEPKLVNSVNCVELGYANWFDSSVFEYDATGVLLGYYDHIGGRQHVVQNPACAKAEILCGRPATGLTTIYGTEPVTLNPSFNFRLYVCSVWGGVPQGDWRDITEASDLSSYGYKAEVNGVVQWIWSFDTTKYYGMVRQDDKLHVQTRYFDRANGYIRFNIEATEIVDGEPVTQPVKIPYGYNDVYINDRPLIEGLDYVVEWPMVIISNVEYLDQTPGAMQKVLYRGYGFCNADLTRPKAYETDFVRYGVLSYKGLYNIHSHKSQYLVIDGHYRDVKDIVFDEDLKNASIVGERNGAPYQVRNVPVVFKDVFENDQLARAQDDIREKQVSDYMSLYFTTPTETLPDLIAEPYHVISIFANKVLNDLLDGSLNPELLTRYTDQDVRNWMVGYEYLANLDICNTDYDAAYVKVWPHWFNTPKSLPFYKYDFYVRVLKLYLNRVPDITAFVNIQSVS